MRHLKRNIFAILVITIIMGVFVLPPSIKQKLPDVPVLSWIKNTDIKKGLDLQGGVQLDYKIDLTKAEAENISKIVEGTRSVIEKRVNSLGLSEPKILVSSVGDEQHIIVELAGIHDVDKAKDLIGKPVSLEFKEKKESLEDTEKDEIKKDAEDTLQLILQDESKFDTVGDDLSTLNPKKIMYEKEVKKFQDQLKDNEKVLWELELGKVYDKVVEDSVVVPINNEIMQFDSLNLYRLLDKKVVERTKTVQGEDFIEVAKEVSDDKEGIEFTDKKLSELPEDIRDSVIKLRMGQLSEIIDTKDNFELYKLSQIKPSKDEVEASHILISYKGAMKAGDGVSRTKEESKKYAEEILEKVKEGGKEFSEYAKEFSDEPGAESSGGYLGYFEKIQMVPEFGEAAFRMEVGQISDIVETEFGYHIINKTGQRKTDTLYSLNRIVVNKSEEEKNAGEKDDLSDTKIGWIYERVKDKEVTEEEEQITLSVITYSLLPDPWKETGLGSEQFEDSIIRANTMGVPYLEIRFNDEGATMFDEITARNVNKPLAIFVGGELVSAPRVNERISSGKASITSDKWSYNEVAELKMLMDAGDFPAPLIIKQEYKIGATLGKESLERSIVAGVMGLLLLALYMIVYYRLMGVLAVVSLVIYSIAILFIVNILSIVMTLAGVAGFLLSIGMAVDANVLIFERIKEELNSGKNLSASINTGFERAWTSIRDSNLSTLLTCFILAVLGTSIVKGFAITLGIGVLVSMLTAIFVTRNFLTMFIGVDPKRISCLFGVKKHKE